MVALPHELKVKRRLMAEYLRRDHIMLVLKRPTLEGTDAGGVVRGEPVDLDPQIFRLYPFIRRVSQYTRDTPDGDIINIRYVLVGLHTADVQAADFFHFDNGLYDVVSVDPMHEDRTVANVTYRGPADDFAWG